MLESQNMESPKGNKHPNIQEGVVNLIKPLYKKVLRKPICDEDLKELDDNEIMDNLVNFTGVLNLWHSLSFQDRFFISFMSFDFFFSQFCFSLFFLSIFFIFVSIFSLIY